MTTPPPPLPPVPPLPTAVQRGLRTAVACVVGVIVAGLAHLGIHVPASEVPFVYAPICAGVTIGYNAGALYAEKRWKWARWLLLNIGTPAISSGASA